MGELEDEFGATQSWRPEPVGPVNAALSLRRTSRSLNDEQVDRSRNRMAKQAKWEAWREPVRVIFFAEDDSGRCLLRALYLLFP